MGNIYTTKKATGICWFILKVAKLRSKVMGDGADKWWTIHNPFKREIQTLVPQVIKKKGRLYKHEMAHDGQLERAIERHGRISGTIRHCVGIVVNILIYSYNTSPLEIEAKAAEEA